MRTATVEIAGKSWPVCYSTAVMLACEERYGSANGVFEALSADALGEKMQALFWLTNQMLRAGVSYELFLGKPVESPPDEDELRDLLGMDDVLPLQRALVSAIVGDVSREVEAEPPKNAGAMPPAAKE